MKQKITPQFVTTQFGANMDLAVEGQERFLVDRQGEPVVIIMSVDDYLTTIAPEDTALKAIRDAAKQSGLDRLTMEEINEEIASYRHEKGSSWTQM